MKKRLEAELLSIAHRILKLKNKSEVDQLYLEAQKLYEALAVLKFYGDNYEQAKSEVALDDWEAKISTSLEEKPVETPIAVAEPVAIEEPKAEEVVATKEESEVTEVEEPKVEEIVATKEETEVTEVEAEVETETEEEPIVVGEITVEEEEIEDEPAETPKADIDFGAIFELAAESPGEIEDELAPEQEMVAEVAAPIEDVKAETKQISLEDLLGENYTEPVFVKPNEVTKPSSKKEVIEDKTEVIVETEKSKSLSLNDKLAKTINIGLNDRMGFVKYLFGESNEDFNRVLSQLNTFSTFEEAKDFIEEIIKPDYNNWEGVEDYAERFIEIVEKRFD